MTETIELVSADAPPKGKRHTTQQSLNSTVKSACDILRRSNCAGAMQYVPELSWMLFLRVFDEREMLQQAEAEALGGTFTPSLAAPYRWQDWAAPTGAKRMELQAGTLGAVKAFVNGELLPHLKSLRDKPNATPLQRIVSEVLSGVENTRVDTDRNLLDVLDKIHEIRQGNVDDTHIYTLSQVYEGLLLKMGEKGNDGGQFFTPREVVRAIVQTLAPQVGETVYDPCCGTGGFLAQAFEYMWEAIKGTATSEQIETLAHDTFFGREKENLIYPIALANLVLHGIDEPHLWHGNTLTGGEVYGGLFQETVQQYKVILTNPPFGGKEGKEAQTDFDFKTTATQVLFLQHVMKSLKSDGRCGIVLDEGVLFRTNEEAFVKTKRRLLDTCDLWCILSLPGGVFSTAGAGVKTNLLFITKGKPTTNIWYYDLSHIKTGKTTPMTLAHFSEYFRLLPDRADSEYSWTVNIAERRAQARERAQPLREQAKPLEEKAAALTLRARELRRGADADPKEAARLDAEAREADINARELKAKAQAIEDAAFDLKAVNPNAKAEGEKRSVEQLIDLIGAKGREVDDALASLRSTIIK